MRTIHVTGESERRVSPDMIRLEVTLTGVYEDYNKALNTELHKATIVRNMISNSGFALKDIQTTRFEVKELTGGEPDAEQGADRYSVAHELCLIFPVKGNQLFRLLMNLANCSAKPELYVEYAVAENENLKNSLLADALSAARRKAVMISRAIGSNLREIQQVDCSVEYKVRTLAQAGQLIPEKARADNLDTSGTKIHIEPADMILSASVTLLYEFAG